LIEAWFNLLQNSGYRLTVPRQALVEIIASSRCALGPLELYDIARREHPGIGLVTVYRTLEKLEELGLIQRIHLPDGCHRYLRSTHGHQHILFCTRCGQVEFFEGDDLAILFSNIAEQSGYLINEHWLQLFGLCSDCQKD
jgi:Fur family ferric uptake transcriptional regulator